MLQDILDVLQLKEDDIVEIHYDLFQAASSILTKIKRILFDFENYKMTTSRSNMKHLSQGEALLEVFGIDASSTIDFEPYLNDRIIDDILKKVSGSVEFQLMVSSVLLGIKENKQARSSAILDQIIPHLHRDDFIFKKEYKIVRSVETAYGKWPQTYGNAFFTDSKYLLDDITYMLQGNILNYLRRNEIGAGERVS